MRDAFINPKNGETYEWPLNHEGEEDSGRGINITSTVNTGGFGLVRQQGDFDPFVLKWTGSILEEAQWVEMWRWNEICRAQTIYLRDFTGATYEGIISEWTPKRVRVAKNMRGGTVNEFHKHEYTFAFTVTRIVNGPLKDIVNIG